MDLNFVYVLLCPKCGCPRYVGKTTKGEKRIREHAKGSKCTDSSRYKKHWVQSLKDQGLMFDWVKLCTLPSKEGLAEAERYWISFFKDRGCPLTNLSAGGDGGTLGISCSDEKKAKISAANKGHAVSQEQRDQISKTLTGRANPYANTQAQRAWLDELHTIPPFKDQHGRIYTSLKQAAETHKLSSSNICNVLKKKRKSTGGLEFTYIID